MTSGGDGEDQEKCQPIEGEGEGGGGQAQEDPEQGWLPGQHLGSQHPIAMRENFTAPSSCLRHHTPLYPTTPWHQNWLPGCRRPLGHTVQQGGLQNAPTWPTALSKLILMRFSLFPISCS